jgi:hypothetical protein
MNTSKAMRLGLKAGDWVVVRSQGDILATLDAQGRLDGLPFQPEMLAYCGKRLRVGKVAHKTCDTINKTGGRSMLDTVHLENIRCDGADHSGCQARCLIFWKEGWLRRDDAAKSAAPRPPASPVCTEPMLRLAVVAPGENPSDPNPTWVCQTTALLDATSILKWWDPRQYVRDVTTGNHTAKAVAKMLSFGIFRRTLSFGIGYGVLLRGYNLFQKLTGGRPYPHASGGIPADQPTPTAKLGLMAGETVQVKPPDEIRSTLNVKGMNRGMWFDQEMVKYCGGTFKVDLRVDRLIDEKTGKMLVMKNPCIQLQNVVCEGECTDRRLGCPRNINIYWRELWLKRV